jgi:8-oxo-dGTP diphosphatase
MTGQPTEHGRFTVAVSALVEHRRTGNVLLLKRSEHRDFAPGIWEDVSGRLYQGEGPEEALRRELREETGITDVRITGMLRSWHTFRGPRRPEYELIGIAYACETSSTEVTLSDEHDDYRWLPAEEAVRLAGADGIAQAIRVFIAQRDARPRGTA